MKPSQAISHIIRCLYWTDVSIPDDDDDDDDDNDDDGDCPWNISSVWTPDAADSPRKKASSYL